jgi:hypothetical protein
MFIQKTLRKFPIDCHVTAREWYVKLINHLVSVAVDRSCYFFSKVAPQSYSWGWVDPVPYPLHVRKILLFKNNSRANFGKHWSWVGASWWTCILTKNDHNYLCSQLIVLFADLAAHCDSNSVMLLKCILKLISLNHKTYFS